ncbi:MAG: protein-disulfide reductase DsbD domain-containing protein, partial [Chthoniobacteraceae bacterium]
MVRLTLICFLSFVSTDFLSAGENPLGIRLVSDVKSIRAGEPFYAGLFLKHPEGGHTYWKFPGIVGVPTNIEWRLPEGFKAGPIEWPEPQRVMMFQIKAQGYEGDTLLPIRITPADSLKPGQKVWLRGKASWMCCGRTCNPGLEDLSLELPVTASAQPDETMEPKFKAALGAAPHPLTGWRAEASRLDGEVRLRLTAVSKEARAQAPAIKQLTFFTEDGLINSDKEQHFSRAGSEVLLLRLRISEYATDPDAKELRGVLQTPEGWSA